MVALPASLSARSFLLTPACPGQYTHKGVNQHWLDATQTQQHKDLSRLRRDLSPDMRANTSYRNCTRGTTFEEKGKPKQELEPGDVVCLLALPLGQTGSHS